MLTHRRDAGNSRSTNGVPAARAGAQPSPVSVDPVAGRTLANGFIDHESDGRKLVGAKKVEGCHYFSARPQTQHITISCWVVGKGTPFLQGGGGMFPSSWPENRTVGGVLVLQPNPHKPLPTSTLPHFRPQSSFRRVEEVCITPPLVCRSTIYKLSKSRSNKKTIGLCFYLAVEPHI